MLELLRSRRVAVTALLFLIAAPLAATTAVLPSDDENEQEEEDKETDKDEDTDWRDDLVLTKNSVTVGGETLSYTATSGTLTLEREDGTERADIFFVAYTKDGVDDVTTRPITYCFNGGPGSSSVWLHLGAFGPRRVVLPSDASMPAPPPYPIEDNPHSLLDLTDMVFIDPVTTGFSRAAEGEDDSQFHGVSEDIASVADFIQLYTTRFERWNSPKFLSGESYGTTRAAGLAGHLQGRHGMFLNGIVLVSSILDFSTARFAAGNDLPYPLFLPTYTATAWYHGRLAPELQADLASTLREVEAFAMSEYTLALGKGAQLSDDERDRIAARLARYTGVSAEYVKQTNLRIVIHEYVKELTRDARETVGRLDSRYIGRDSDAYGSTNEYDPSYSAIQGPFTAALNHYVRAELDYENDLPYEILTGRVHPWNYGEDDGYVNTGKTLRSAMTQNPHLKVFVANGYYDLATPYFATQYTFDHLGLEPALQGNVSMAYYEAGHMMYIHEPSAMALKADIARFFATALDR
jgi:carboxypeptidase C (cathepsin A)